MLPDFILRIHSNQNSKVQAQKQTQTNGLESPAIKPHTYAQLIYDKGGKTIPWRKGSLFNKWGWENWTATCKRMR